MKKRQQATLEILAHIPSFLDDYALELGPLHRSPSRVALDGIIRELTASASEQATAAGDLRACMNRKQALRRELRTRFLRPIASIALMERVRVPGVDVFRCPKTNLRDDLFLDQAESIGTQAAKRRHVFLRRRMPSDFVQQLRGMIDAIDREIDQSAESLQRQKAATAALLRAFSRAVRIVRLLDALVKARAGGHLALVAAWDAMLRVEVRDARRDLMVVDAA